MRSSLLLSLSAAIVTVAGHSPTAKLNGVTYNGLYKDQVEFFWGIQYGQDTGGSNRFKPPKPFVPEHGCTVEATRPRAACPQEKGTNSLPLYLGNITEISEDCLLLNVARPNGTTASSKLPVMVYIHGGSFVAASKDEPASQPGGLILQSVEIGRPILHVALNYRLGVFGFAQSEALNKEGSENAGLRDQRLALEWVHKNIAAFGGDPSKITIHGQSSGGLAMGMQTVAFGGRKPAPFNQIIAQSQVLEGGITGNFTRDAMKRVTNVTSCNTTDVQSPATIRCLRGLSTSDLLKAQLDTYTSGPQANIGDEWLPVVDGDFLPAPPSELLATGQHYNVTTMIGWCEDDAQIFPDPLPSNASAVRQYFRQYLPGYTEQNLDHLLNLYPISDFHSSYFPNGTIQVTAQGYRTGRILRDIALTCQPFYFGEALAKSGNDVYYYVTNQTILTPILNHYGIYGYGKVHTSDFAYMFGNLSHYDIYDLPFHPEPADYALKDRASRSWASYAALGYPSVGGKGTLEGWKKGDNKDANYGVYVMGGPNEGYSGKGGKKATVEAMKLQKLQDRCSFLNRPDSIKQDGY
ncbi:hypothetical protein M409DRAFT_19859 [Zasmidium cellare ATCC 36951]|uniref:Carboxylic ester hydrolase n=1 Tax=Zasmidium cellare ATCC 36951 TaxID=1080233 RepID=A0A6A6CY09_ZASCE|nr:uncharacterized protein M409DRAFT_19859 [Zasmidium cellare ATCC 36951]KAF2170256.1 hypothetical protein M409DRAFT_19859 [Zasmidium cellare ATCC 36951]